MESQGYRATNESGAAAYPAHPGAGVSPPTAGQNDPERVKNEARREAQSAKDEVGATAQQAKQQAGEMGRQAKDAARQAADQTKRKATEYAEQAKTRGAELIEEQRHNAASQLHTVGEAVHRAADKFREDRDENIAGYVDAMADEVDRCAQYLEKRDTRALLRDTQQFARRNPEWFLGGMFFAGLALSRFLKASRPEPSGPSYAGNGGERSWERPSATGVTDTTRATATMPTTTSSLAGAASIAEPGTTPTLPGESGTVC